MKNPITSSKPALLIGVLFLIGSVSAFAPSAKPADEYLSSAFKFAFTIPKDSMPGVGSSERAVIYFGRPRRVVGSDAAMMVTTQDAPTPDKLSAPLSDDTYLEPFAKAVISKVAGSHEYTVVEKKRAQVAGLNALNGKDKKSMGRLHNTVPGTQPNIHPDH